MLRSFFIFLSQRPGLRRWMEHSAMAKPLTRRFIAGNTLEEALGACERLNREGIFTTLDYLGESVTDVRESERCLEQCLKSLEGIHARGLQSSISVKLTQLGLDIDPGVCLANGRRLVGRATELGLRVEFDMESSGYVDRTLAIVEQLHGDCDCVRAVLQAYLHRTEADVRRMNSLRVPVRLCKGAYSEPETVAYPDKAEVDANYLKLASVLLREGNYPALATHDDRMVEAGKGQPSERFEYQMLYGVRRDLQSKLRKEGYRVRVYVPYGEAWYPYFMRRLAERPANVWFILRNLLKS